jgi:hypothetical protein
VGHFGHIHSTPVVFEKDRGSLLFEACLFEEPYKKDRPGCRVAQRLIFALTCVQNCLVEHVRLDVDQGSVAEDERALAVFVRVARKRSVRKGTKAGRGGRLCDLSKVDGRAGVGRAAHIVEQVNDMCQMRLCRARCAAA